MKAKLNDTWNFITKIRSRRIWNAVLVLGSYYISRFSGRPVQWGQPITLSIEPTTACNLRCPECPSGLRAFTRPTGNLKADFFRSVIDEMYQRLQYLIFYFQGEPYINPAFLDMVSYAVQKGLYTITSTNGHFLDDDNARRTVASGLDRIIISIDGATQDVYEQYRIGGNLKKVLEGARTLVKWKKQMNSTTPYVIFQMLVVRPNEHELEAVRQLAADIGVDELKFKTAQVYDYAQGNPLIPTLSRYARYRQNKDGSWSPKHVLSRHCWKLWHAAVITWDGQVVPCCFDKDARHNMGNLQNERFATIWKSPAYRDFRMQLFKGRHNIDICTNCSEGCTVWS
ncbi:MAG: SPASM domain-containing protein [Lewinellaceae bacterium]|nr:SPASM domain-containing protein [Lewinellaceae bacterium]